MAWAKQVVCGIRAVSRSPPPCNAVALDLSWRAEPKQLRPQASRRKQGHTADASPRGPAQTRKPTEGGFPAQHRDRLNHTSRG